MKLPLTGWKKTLRALGYKVVWKNDKKRKSDRPNENQYGPLEPRQMLATTCFDQYCFEETGGSVTDLATAVPEYDDQSNVREIVITEGDSFRGTLFETVDLSGLSELRVVIESLQFPDADNQTINDSFELALLDPTSGVSLVSTIGPGRDSFFNLTEATDNAIGGSATTATLSQNTTLVGGTIFLDLAGLNLSGDAKLAYRLVNDDVAFDPSDTQSTVTLNTQPTSLSPEEGWLLTGSSPKLQRVTDYDPRDGNTNSITNYGNIKYHPLKNNDTPANSTANINGAVEAFAVRADGVAFFSFRKDAVNGHAGSEVLIASIDLNSLPADPPNKFKLVADLVAYLPDLDADSSSVTSIAFHPLTGEAYLLVNQDNATDELWTYDFSSLSPGTVVALNGSRVGNKPLDGTPAGGFEAVTDAQGMTFATPLVAGSQIEPKLYVIDNNDDHLYEIDPVTANVTELVDNNLFGGLSVSPIINALSYDQRNNRLVAAGSTQGAPLLEINLGNAGNEFITDASTITNPTATNIQGISFLGATILDEVIVVRDSLPGPGTPIDHGSAIDQLTKDVTNGFDIRYAQSSFNEASEVLYSNLLVENLGTEEVLDVVAVGITNISDSSVTVESPDGVSLTGIPYMDFSHLAAKDGNGLFLPGLTEDLELRFHNPDGITFTFDLVVLTTEPVVESRVVSVSDGAQFESVEYVQIPVTLDSPASEDITVDYQINAGTATEGLDYSGLSGSITIDAGLVEGTIYVTVLDENLVELDETFEVELVSAASTSGAISVTFGNQLATGTIINDDSAAVTVTGTQSIIEGDSGNTPFAFTVSLSNPVDVDVDVSLFFSSYFADSADYTGSFPSVVTIPAGATELDLDGTVVGDTIPEVNAGLVLSATGVDGGGRDVSITTGPDQGAEVTIVDDDDVTASIGDVSVLESIASGFARFTVQLDHATPVDLYMEYYTSDGTAGTADYTEQYSSITILAGESQGFIDIAITDDNIVELDETFFVHLIDVESYLIGDGTGQGTIVDDDQATVTLSGTQSIVEGDVGSTPFEIGFTLSNPVDVDVTLQLSYEAYYSDGSNYTYTGDVPSSVTIPSGSLEVTVAGRVLGDTIPELNADLFYYPNSSIDAEGRPVFLGQPDFAVISIIDDDSIAASISDVTVPEDIASGFAAFIVDLDNPTLTGFNLAYAVADGTAETPADFSGGNQSIFVPAGAEEIVIEVPIVNDETVELDETFSVLLLPNEFLQFTDDTAVGTILNDDSATLTVSGAQNVIEGDSGTTPFEWTINLSNPVDAPVTVSLGYNAYTLDANDYIADVPSVVIPANTTSFAVPGAAVGDLLPEPDGAVLMHIAGFDGSGRDVSHIPSGGVGVTIIDDDDIFASISDVLVSEDIASGVARFVVQLDRVTPVPLYIEYTSYDGTASSDDYTNVPYDSIIIPAGSDQGFIDIAITDDNIVESDETFFVELIQGVVVDIADGVGEGTIVNDDQALITIADISEFENSATGVFTVTLTNPVSEDISFAFESFEGTATDGNDIVENSGIVSVSAGDTTATVAVQNLDDDLVELLESYTVELSSIVANGLNVQFADATALGEIFDDDSSELSIAGPASIVEGTFEGEAVYTLSLTHQTVVDTVVTLTSVGISAVAGEDFTDISGLEITIPAFETSATFAVPIVNDSVFEVDEDFKVEIFEFTGLQTVTSTDEVTTTILDDDPEVTAITLVEDQRLITTDSHASANGASTDFVIPHDPESRPLGAINGGVWAYEPAMGQGWILHSVESISDRFPSPPNQFQSDQSNNLVAVRFYEGQWEFTDNYNWVAFTPVSTDVLLAEVDYTIDTITSLEGENEIIEGIQAGYVSGDLEFFADMIGDQPDEDEFKVTGTSFQAYDYSQAIRIDFSELAFDSGGNPGDINDAFELMVLDQNGDSVVSTISANSNAALNITQGQEPLWGTGVELYDAGGTLVTPQNWEMLDLSDGYALVNASGVAAGTVVTLSARLVNNDTDNTTTVKVDFKEADPNQGQFALQGFGVGNVATFAENKVNATVDFSLLSDVSQSFDVEWTTTTANNGGSLSFAVDVSKQPQFSIRNDLIIAISNLSLQDSSGFGSDILKNFDGVLPVAIGNAPAGSPYIRLTNLLDKDNRGFFVDEATIENLLLEFEGIEPDERFDFELTVLGVINSAPEFTSDPYETYRGNAYPVERPISQTESEFILEIEANGTNEFRYVPETSDREDDEVFLSKVTGPTGLEIVEGELIWAPELDQTGVWSIRIRATDEFGSFLPENDHRIILRVVEPANNRPPEFISDPVRTAQPGVEYGYDSDAFDRDGDDLVYAGTIDWPDAGDFNVDPATGDVSWTPPADAAGQLVEVTLTTTDPEGLFDKQVYEILVSDRLPPEPGILDLTLENVDVEGLTVHSQDLSLQGVVTVDVINAGPDIATEPYEVLFFEDRDFNEQYDPANDVILGSTIVETHLGEGESLTVSAAINAEVQFVGAAIWAFVDSREVVVETNEDNNYARSHNDCYIVSDNPLFFDPVVKYIAGDPGETNGQLFTTPRIANLDGMGAPEIIFFSQSVYIANGEDGTPFIGDEYRVNDLGAQGDLVIADIDGDDKIEIVSAALGNAAPSISVYHLDEFGIFERKDTYQTAFGSSDHVFGELTLANVDDDAAPEIISGFEVLDFSVTGSGATEEGVFNRKILVFEDSNGDPVTPSASTNRDPIVGNFDNDPLGIQEIFVGGALISAYETGPGINNLVWVNETLPGTYETGVADFNDDGTPEFVINDTHTITILDPSDGSVLHTVSTGLPSNTSGGGASLDSKVTIADFDNDGAPEVGVTSNHLYLVTDVHMDGSTEHSWTAPIDEDTSGFTGSTVYDLDADGYNEIIFADETSVWVYSIFDSENSGPLSVRFQDNVNHGSGTASESPVVADFDGDGHAEFGVISTPYNGGNSPSGVVVYEDRFDGWVGARDMWNEDAYHLSHVNEDYTIPATQTPSWTTHNTFRTQGVVESTNLRPGPDLIPSYARIVDNGDGTTTYTIRVGNGGIATAEGPYQVALFQGQPDSGNEVPIQVVTVASDLEPGQFIDVEITHTGSPLSLADQWYSIDWLTDAENTTGFFSVNECHENNNLYNPVVGVVNNRAPVIESDPPLTDVLDADGNVVLDGDGNPRQRPIAVEGVTFLYDVEASDPDNDPAQGGEAGTDTLHYSLLSAPFGMRIDSVTGLIEWTPTASQVKTLPSIAVQVTDGKGMSDVQTFNILVLAAPAPPTIVSRPPTDDTTNNSVGTAGRDWIYNVRATDPNGDNVTYSIDDPTLELVQTGGKTAQIRWIDPQEGDTKTFTITATDWTGLSDTQTVIVEIGPATDEPGFGDTLPDFISVPINYAIPGEVYTYNAIAIDPDGPPVYSLVTDAPGSMTIDASTGVVTWDTAGLGLDDTDGPFIVEITATQAMGSATQGYELIIAPEGNLPPVIIPESGLVAPAFGLFQYDVVARDPEGFVPLIYALLDDDGNEVTTHNGFSIDSSGQVTWNAGGAGDMEQFTVKVRDYFGGSDVETFDVLVVVDNPPEAELNLDGDPATSAGDIVELRIRTRDDHGIDLDSREIVLSHPYIFDDPATGTVEDTFSLELALDGSASWQYAGDPYALTETITVLADGSALDTTGQLGTATQISFTVEPLDINAPVVQITNPLAEAALEEEFTFEGKIYDFQDDLVSYTWELLDINNVVLESGGDSGTLSGFDSPETKYPLATIDPGAYDNGFYTLRLTATDAGNLIDSFEIQVEFEANAELGDMEVAFEDLRVPVRGLPIVITRTYDSGESDEVGDFGNGWELDITNFEVDIQYPDEELMADGRPVFETGSRIVITLPDGTQEGFTFNPQSHAILNARHIPYYQPDYGVTSKLSSTYAVMQKTGIGWTVFNDPGSGTYYHPASDEITENGGTPTLELTLRNGDVIAFNAETGEIYQIEDRNGDTLTFTDFGIESSAGRSVDFVRDEENRITAIVDPAGNVLTYTYDPYGNLATFTDRMEATSGFSYDEDQIHYLTEIKDPLGRSAVRTFYEAETNRVDYIIDADNRILDYHWHTTAPGQLNLAGLDGAAGSGIEIFATVEELEDGRAIYTVTYSDSDEHPLRIETSMLTGTFVEYDSETGLATSVNIDGVDFSEDLPEITIREYNVRNQVTQQITVIGAVDTDAGVNESNDLVTVYNYDPDTFDLLSVDTPRGIESTTNYNEFGQPLRVTDRYGNWTQNTYDDQTGQLLRATNQDGSSRLTYYDDGSLKAAFDATANQRLVFTEFNEFGDIVFTEDSKGNVARFGYDINGNEIWSTRTQSIDADFDGVEDTIWEFRTDTKYDLENRVIEKKQQKRNRTTGDAFVAISTSDSSDKNPLGQNVTTFTTMPYSDGQNPQRSSRYDLRGQSIETIRTAFGSDGVEQYFASRSTYDSKGRVVYSMDEYLSDAQGSPIAQPGELFGSRNYYDEKDRTIQTERLVGLTIDVVDRTPDSLYPEAFLDAVVGSHGSVISSSATVYDNAGRVQSTTSFNTASTNPADGLTTTYFYNAYGEMTQVVSESWDAAGTDKVLMVSRSVFDSNGRAIFSVSQYLADGTNLDASPRTIHGTKTLFDQDRGRNYGSERYENVVVSFNASTGETTLVDAGDLITSTSTTFDERGRTKDSISADGQVTSYEYDELGRQVAVIGPSHEARFYNESEQTSELRTVRHRSETVYDERGRVAVQRTGVIHNGIAHNEHDYSQQQETSYFYDENGNVARTVLDDGSYAMIRYDELGRKIADSQQVAASVSMGWSEDVTNGEPLNSFVDLTKSPGDEGYVVPTRLSSYDSQGRLESVTLSDPNPLDSDPQRSVYQYGYDFRGQQTSIIDPLGRETKLTYDALGRQESRLLPLAAGDDGIHGSADDTTFAETTHYDDRGRHSMTVSFEGVAMVSVYDDATGRMKATQYFEAGSDINGMPDNVRVYSYDDYGRQIGVMHSYINGENAGTSRTESMTYNDRGQLESATGDEGTFMYLYDEFGRQTEVRNTTATVAPGTNLESVDWENITNYAYDEMGRLETVHSVERNDVQVVDANSTLDGDQPDITTYEYDLVGNLDATIYADGIVHDYQYNSLNRLTKLLHFVDEDGDLFRDDGGIQGSSEILQAQFEYDLRADGKRTASTERFGTFSFNGGDSGLQEVTYEWEYDDAGRLIQEIADSTENSFGPGGQDPFEAYTTTFTYDLTGNRTLLEKDLGSNGSIEESTTYQYDANDRLEVETKTVGSDVTETLYEYDFTQQTLKEVFVNGSSVAESSQEFEYNLQGRMSKVTTTTGSETTSTEYRYETQGNRIWSRHTAADGTETVTEFLTDSRNHTGYSQVAVETKTVDGVLQERKIYTIGHDQISQARFIHNGASWDEGETVYFGTDGHGSVRVLFDLAADIAVHSGVDQIFHFDAYGNLLNLAGSASLTGYLYSGEAFDFNIGQQYLRARWYDASTGRFNRLDPFFGNLTDPQSLHKYAYVHGDPIQGLDPTGMFNAISVGTAVSIGAWGLGNGLLSLYAGKSFGSGFVGGIVGGIAFNMARLMGPAKFKDTVWSAFIGGAVTTIVAEAFELYENGELSGGWSIAASFLDGLNWGAFYEVLELPGGDGFFGNILNGALSGGITATSGIAGADTDAVLYFVEKMAEKWGGLEVANTQHDFKVVAFDTVDKLQGGLYEAIYSGIITYGFENSSQWIPGVGWIGQAMKRMSPGAKSKMYRKFGKEFGDWFSDKGLKAFDSIGDEIKGAVQDYFEPEE